MIVSVIRILIHIYTHVMSMKLRTNILIEESVLRKAKSIGINVSKACENYLKILTDIIEQTNSQIKQQIKTNSEKRKGMETMGVYNWWTGRDLNPRPPDCKSGVHSRLNYRPFIIDG